MSIVLPDRPALKRRVWTPRLVATLALFVVSAAFFCAIVGNALVHQVDERQDLERRAALLGAIEDLRTQVNPDSSNVAAFQARYPGAQVRNFSGGTGAANGTVTEMDALVAYLQVLGTMVDFRRYDARANIR